MNKYCVAISLLLLLVVKIGQGQEITGVNVTPHQFSSEMRWRSTPNPELSAKTELFLRNNTDAVLPLTPDGLRFDGQSPQKLLSSDQWVWHDTPASWLSGKDSLPKDCLTVFTFNGKSAGWGIGTDHRLQLNGKRDLPFRIEKPDAFLSAVTFLSVDSSGKKTSSVKPNQIVVHIQNNGDAIQPRELRIWLPTKKSNHHVFRLARTYKADSLDPFSTDGMIPENSKGGFTVTGEPLPLTYCVLELSVGNRKSLSKSPSKSPSKPETSKARTLWAHLRIKREAFDISGGWVASDVGGRNSLTIDEYRRTLKRMHINTGQIQDVGGFTDQRDIYEQLPLKRFNRMWPLERYDTDAMLKQIHAVEFLGEPQYGGGRPVPPQEVWEKLAPYQPSRLPTSLTLSEERTWRYYAGLSDYPHYDAYRVIAPAADSWRNYDRWGDQRIRWGAPLETIGTMTRSLRELSRPRPIAYWSQGAHHGWGSRWNPRRGSPNAEELRSQAWHGLANRVTSLYWFNLSLKSLVKYPDLIEPITRVNREALMLQDIILTGEAFEYRRSVSNGRSDFDLNSIASPNTLLMAAHDLRYRVDAKAREFRFDQREAELKFKIPNWLGGKLDVFRVDADGCHDVKHSITGGAIKIRDGIKVVGLYVATNDPAVRNKLATAGKQLREKEETTRFNPGKSDADLQRLRFLLKGEKAK